MQQCTTSPLTRDQLADDVLGEWQNLIDTTAAIFGVPAGLITRVDGPRIEILLASTTTGNPYPAGADAPYPDSGWYCEHTLKTRRLNLVADALADPAWRENDAVKAFNMVSYLGLPVLRPDGGAFGTVCFLDDKANPHNDLHIALLHQVKRMVELSLRIIYDRAVIDRQEKLIAGLSRIYPICCYCKQVREHDGAWVQVEKYVENVTGSLPSHGICPACYDRELAKL